MIVKKILLYLWQMPQHLLALLIWGALRLAGRVAQAGRGPGNVFITVRVPRWGVSLGRYVFMDEGYGPEDWKHEQGHSVWSMYLGWLYLPVVGIYSAVFCNLWNRLFHKGWNSYDRHYWYYKTRWTEREADKAGGVDRDAVLRRIPRPENSRYPAVSKAS